MMAKTTNPDVEAVTEAPVPDVDDKPEKPEKPKKPTKPALVEIDIPRAAPNDEPNILIAVNGVSYLLPKGKKSQVPAEIAEEYKRSVRAQQRLDERVEELVEAGRQIT